MKQFFQTVWWWARISVLIVVALYALALIWFNATQRADVWYWPGRPAENTSVIALVLASFIAGGLVCTTGWALFSAWVNLRRTRELRRKRAEQEQRELLQRKAAMLRTKPTAQPTIRTPKPPAPVIAEPEPIIEPLKPEPKRPTVVPVVVPIDPPKPVEPVIVPVASDVPAVAEPQPAAPIVVEAHRATPFASQPIAAGTTPTPPKPAEPDVIDPPPPSDGR